MSTTPTSPAGTSLLLAAEDILPGHPDRVCDAIAESVVNTAMRCDLEALVGVEVALHRNLVVVTGRVAATANTGDAIELGGEQVEQLVADAFVSAGYAGRWTHPVRVHTDLDIGPLNDDERSIRPFSDDQTIAVGYADPNGPHSLPVETNTVRTIRRYLEAAREAHPDALGPDGKVLITVEAPGSRDRRARLHHINVAIQHAPGVSMEDLHRMVVPELEECLGVLASSLDVPTTLDGTSLRLNGIGDFTCGGPMGDNGLSGKKLVVDHYGPNVPIGGGALCGKDVHKPDRVGPLRARQIAVRLARETGETTLVHLGWLPGLEAPDRLSARLGNGRTLDRNDIASLIHLPDLSLAASAWELELACQDWVEVMRWGYFGNGQLWEW